MKKLLIGVLIMAALACGSDAAELFGVPDAGAQSGGTFDYTCPEAGLVLTDIDQRPLGEITVYLNFISPFEGTEGRVIDQQYHPGMFIDGKVYVSCHAGRDFTVEVR